MYVSAKGVKYTINEYIDKNPDNEFLNKIKNDGYSVRVGVYHGNSAINWRAHS